jgi:hypothetical protein
MKIKFNKIMITKRRRMDKMKYREGDKCRKDSELKK